MTKLGKLAVHNTDGPRLARVRVSDAARRYFDLGNFTERNYTDIVQRDEYPTDLKFLAELAGVEAANNDPGYLALLASDGYTVAYPTRDDFHRDRVNTALNRLFHANDIQYSGYAGIPRDRTLSARERSDLARNRARIAQGFGLEELRAFLISRLRSGEDSELNNIFRDAILNHNINIAEATDIAGSSLSAFAILNKAIKSLQAIAKRVVPAYIIPGNAMFPGFARSDYDSLVTRNEGLNPHDPRDRAFLDGLGINNEKLKERRGTGISSSAMPDLGRFNEDRASIAIDILIRSETTSGKGFKIIGRIDEASDREALDEVAKADFVLVASNGKSEIIFPLQIKSSQEHAEEFARRSKVAVINAHRVSLGNIAQRILSAIDDRSKVHITKSQWDQASGTRTRLRTGTPVSGRVALILEHDSAFGRSRNELL